jgi:hypothetical protein
LPRHSVSGLRLCPGLPLGNRNRPVLSDVRARCRRLYARPARVQGAPRYAAESARCGVVPGRFGLHTPSRQCKLRGRVYGNADQRRHGVGHRRQAQSLRREQLFNVRRRLPAVRGATRASLRRRDLHAVTAPARVSWTPTAANETVPAHDCPPVNASRPAAIVRSMSASVCAAEMKAASNCDGGQ